MKIWLRDALPVSLKIKGITYDIGPDEGKGGVRQMNLQARREDTGRSIKLAILPAAWYRDEYDRHAWFESWPRTPARKLADALIVQDLAVREPGVGWTYQYEVDVLWTHIAHGCEFHDGLSWKRKTFEDKPPSIPTCYLIRY